MPKTLSMNFSVQSKSADVFVRKYFG